jgi:hypothetical protein
MAYTLHYMYVKTGGTCSTTAGRYLSPKTGSWATAFASAAEYYGSMATAFAQCGAYDVICYANTSSSSAVDFTNLEQCHRQISVSESSVDTPAKGYVVTQTAFRTFVALGSGLPDAWGTSAFQGHDVYGLIFNIGTTTSGSFQTYGRDLSVGTVNHDDHEYYSDIPAVYTDCEFNLISTYGYLTLMGYPGIGRPTKGVYFINCDFTIVDGEYHTFLIGPGWQTTEPTGLYAELPLFFINCRFSSIVKSTPLFGVNESLYQGRKSPVFLTMTKLTFENCDFYNAKCPIFPVYRDTQNTDFVKSYKILFDRCRFNNKYHFPGGFKTLNMHTGIEYAWCVYE